MLANRLHVGQCVTGWTALPFGKKVRRWAWAGCITQLSHNSGVPKELGITD